MRRRSALVSGALAMLLAVPAQAYGAEMSPQPSQPPPAAAIAADVVVYGATPGGISAAVAAARSGSSVVLVEPRTHIGGMMSNGLGHTDLGDEGVIGGLAVEFFERTAEFEGAAGGLYRFHPSSATAVFHDMLSDAGVRLVTGSRLIRSSGGITLVRGRIVTIYTANGHSFTGDVFVDATYEGDLMALAGVTYRVGRESIDAYDEFRAGVRRTGLVMAVPPGLDPGVPLAAPGAPGTGDNRIQNSNFRLCMTKDPGIRVPVAKPAGYDADQYALVAEFIRQRVAMGQAPRAELVLHMDYLGGGKYDVNENGPVSFGLPGANYEYPEGSFTRRAEIEAQHRSYQKGFLYFITHDPRVPAVIRAEMAAFGLCADEFTDNGYWPRMLYLREARRMVGGYVATQHDVEALVSKPDTIGLASYRLDAHVVSRWLASDGNLYVEGGLGGASVRRWSIPYRSLTPQSHQVTNLLVPVAASVSHVAHGSLRMEPQYMIMGEAAGVAAAVAAGRNISVQAVPVGELQATLRARGAVLDDPGDIADSFYTAIAWAYFEGITTGCGVGLFCPKSALPRDQMAALLSRALDLPGTTEDFFDDDTGSTFEDDINRVAAAGITFGCGPRLYCPKRVVTREQMAGFLARAFQLPPTTEDFFTDDEASTLEVSINRLAASGITAGCTATTFCPTATVTRGQTLAFLYRHYDGGPSGGWVPPTADDPSTDDSTDAAPTPSPSPTQSPSPDPSATPAPTGSPAPSPTDPAATPPGSGAPTPTPSPLPSGPTGPTPGPTPGETPGPTPSPAAPP